MIKSSLQEKISGIDYCSTQVNFLNSKNIFLDFIKTIPSEIVYDDESKSYGLEKEPHITVLYGIKSPEDFDKIKKLVSGFGTITAKLGKISKFEQNKFDVIKIDVISSDLSRLNKLLKDNIDYVETHPGFHPHITLAYVKKGMGDKYLGDNRFAGKQFKFNNIMFSDKGKGKKTIPLSKIGKLNEDLGYGSGFFAPAGVASGQSMAGGFMTGGQIVLGGQFKDYNGVGKIPPTTKDQYGNIVTNFNRDIHTIDDADWHIEGFDPDELRSGIVQELSKMSIKDKERAKQNAMKNLKDNPNYYSELQKYNIQGDNNMKDDKVNVKEIANIIRQDTAILKEKRNQYLSQKFGLVKEDMSDYDTVAEELVKDVIPQIESKSKSIKTGVSSDKVKQMITIQLIKKLNATLNT